MVQSHLICRLMLLSGSEPPRESSVNLVWWQNVCVEWQYLTMKVFLLRTRDKTCWRFNKRFTATSRISMWPNWKWKPTKAWKNTGFILYANCFIVWNTGRDVSVWWILHSAVLGNVLFSERHSRKMVITICLTTISQVNLHGTYVLHPF